MNLLINDSPLIVLPHLAIIIGPDEALLLQQLHFRLKNQGVKREGEKGLKCSHFLVFKILLALKHIAMKMDT